MELSFRRHEGVTLICQNNEEESVLVYGFNEVMQELTGYTEEEIKGQPLQALLAPKAAEAINDYLEFEEDRNDLYEVLRKTRDLRFKAKDGEEIPVESFKVVRIDAKDRHQWFRLIVEDEVHKREIEAFKKILTDNFKGHEVLDTETELPDRTSIEKDLELSQYYADSKGLEACFAYVRVDGFEDIVARYGRKTAVHVLQHVAGRIRRNLRADDTIGRVAEDALGIILMDISLESARIVMNRLRWLITSEELNIDEMKHYRLTVSICFATVVGDIGAALPERCGEQLGADAEAASVLMSLT